MFIVGAENQSYPYPVSVGVIDESGARVTKKFKVRFKRMSQDELDVIHKRVTLGKSLSIDSDAEQEKLEPLSDNELVKMVVVGFVDGVLDKDGNALPFNEDNLVMLANTFPARPAIVQAFFDSINKSLQKN